MAHDKHRDLAVSGLQLLKCGYDKHSRFPHARLCLAYDVHAQDSLRDALMLYCNKREVVTFTPLLLKPI